MLTRVRRWGSPALLTASELAYRVLTTAGAGYMLWLGASMIWKSFRGSPRHGGLDIMATAVAVSPWQGWLIGAGTNLLNPKVGVVYIATIPQFLPAGASPLLMGAVLAGVHGALTLIWLAVLILCGGYARRWLANPKALAVIDRVTGLVLVAFRATLITDSLPSAPRLSPRWRRGWLDPPADTHDAVSCGRARNQVVMAVAHPAPPTRPPLSARSRGQ